MRTRPLLILAILLIGAFALKSLSVIDGVFDLVAAEALAAPASEPEPEEDHHEDEAHAEEEEDTPPPPRPAMLDESRYDTTSGSRIPTASQVSLESDLAQRRRQISERERALDTREQLLRVSETRIDERRAELEAIRDEVLELLGQLDDHRQQQIDAIVATVAGLEPEAAAGILTAMRESDSDTLLLVCESLNTDQYRRGFQGVLAALDPQLAAWIMIQLRLRAEPDDAILESEARNVARADG